MPMPLGGVGFFRSPGRALLVAKQVGMVIVLLGLGFTAASWVAAETATVDCNTGGAVGPTLARLKPGDVLLVQGTCRENILIQAGINHVILDGQGKGTIHAPDPRQPSVQVPGREITIKGLTVTGGQFGIAINRGATAIVEGNTMQNAVLSGLEVSQNSFARVVNNSIRQNQSHGVLVLGSASVHFGVMQTGDRVPQPNVVATNPLTWSWSVFSQRRSRWPLRKYGPRPSERVGCDDVRLWDSVASLHDAEVDGRAPQHQHPMRLILPNAVVDDTRKAVLGDLETTERGILHRV